LMDTPRNWIRHGMQKTDSPRSCRPPSCTGPERLQGCQVVKWSREAVKVRVVRLVPREEVGMETNRRGIKTSATMLMNDKRRSCQWILVCGTVMCSVTLWMCAFTGRVNYLNYLRIQKGMTLDEVEHLLGRGREINGSNIPQSPSFSEPIPERRAQPVVRGDRCFVWETESLEIYVGVTENVVQSKWYWMMSP
jgi:hypothetical protein